ncbi:MAG: hypothetical protein Q4G33_05760 [bacterium]|nr:hypothetical protein [bacterium]
MKFFSDDFIITYTTETQNLVEVIEVIVEALIVNMKKIMDFFGLKEFNNKKEIIIYSNIDKYAKHMSKYILYQDWMIADTSDGNINILSLDMCQKTNAHKNMSYEEYKKVILHEFVHICQSEINPNSDGCEWFWEALATNLSGQIFYDININCTKEALMYDYYNLAGNYAITYKIGKYMLENMKHDKILEYVRIPERLCNETEAILQTVKTASKKFRFK